MQILFDFGGYSDMAVGLGRMLGFEFVRNFDYPYVSKTLSEFWQRWHISLSTWFRDYLFNPLGGYRCSRPRAYANLMTVFILCGLWHGASWNFLLFGLYQGAILLAVYSAGLGIPFLLAAFAVEPMAAFISRFKRHLDLVEKVMGGLLVLTGIAFLTGFVTEASFWLLEWFPVLGRIG